MENSQLTIFCWVNHELVYYIIINYKLLEYNLIKLSIYLEAFNDYIYIVYYVLTLSINKIYKFIFHSICYNNLKT
jgi:hypothetical protein